MDLKAVSESSAEKADIDSPSSNAVRHGDIHDPLNWPTWRKIMTLSIVCIAAFSGLISAFSFTPGLVVEAKTFNVTPGVMAYGVSSAVAGVMAGPVVIVPISRIIGINSTLFWAMILLIAVSIWGGTANGPDDYTSFVVSRGFAGLFGTIPQVLGNAVIKNTFPLHQHGKAFSYYATSFTLGAISGVIFGGFIVQHTQWSVQVWYTVALQGFSAILIFALLEDTYWDRSSNSTSSERYARETQQSWIVRRVRSIVPGMQREPRATIGQALAYSIRPFTIIASPITILAGIFQMVAFGWFILIASEIAVFLEEPYAPSMGYTGYGFSAQQTAAFSFSMFIGVLLAQPWGQLLNDRIPLAVSRRFGNGAWHPEYRLQTLWLPGLICTPVGMGLFGAGLEYHLHFMVLAVGAFLVAFGATASIPVSLNYVVESFQRNPQEVGTCMNLYRLLLALIVPFFLQQWIMAVGIGWVFGTCAFIGVFAFGLIGVLMIMGRSLRRWSIGETGPAEGEGKVQVDH